MSMLYSNSPAQGKAFVGQACKPDYESLIKSAQHHLAKHKELLDAIFDFNDYNTVQGKMAELVGEIYSNAVSIEARISRLIAEQEKDDE